MKRYDLTEDGHHRKFRVSKPEVDESPEQFIVRLDRYLLRWLELSDTKRTFDSLKDFIVKEQFIDSCPKDLAIHLRERAPETFTKIAKIADQYLEAHGKHLFSPASRKPTVQPERAKPRRCRLIRQLCIALSVTPKVIRLSTAQPWQKSVFCVASTDTKLETVDQLDGDQEDQIGMVTLCTVVKCQVKCLVQPPEVKPTDEEVKACIKEDKLMLACGKKIPLLRTACVELLTGVRSQMPVVKGRVGEKSVDVLRDTGCSGIVVKKDLVSEDQFTGDFNVMLLIDNTTRKVPIAKIDIDTPYFKGQVEAHSLPNAVYDLIVGNVPGARAADDPDPS